ncbi:hypothetical protein [Nocardiopsis lucentensis]|uniref:hypothetical protein n=1 Tax=Nocardiopsis lucentensis TaxID=53441 RepID=UPI000347E593|nr:hypothetical protein [Nocardiopsis lucentensis]
MSVAVMAHRKREKFVPGLVASLDRPAKGVWDQKNDRWDTGRRAMLAYESGATHHLVIQDDAVVCRNLVAGVERALTRVPAPHGTPTPLCLYAGRVKRFRSVVRRHVGSRRPSWLAMPSIYWGVGVVMPVQLISELIRWGDQHPEVANYDYRMGQWLRQQGVEVWYPWPSLVDHRHSPSLVEGRSSAASRHAHSFIGANASALSHRWNRGVVRIPHWKDDT